MSNPLENGSNHSLSQTIVLNEFRPPLRSSAVSILRPPTPATTAVARQTSQLNPSKRKYSSLNQSRRFTLSHLYSYRNNQDSGDITCSICFGILKEPHSHSCTETYCYDCLQKCKNKCPSCREPLEDSLMPSPKLLTEKLGNLDVICAICSEITQLDKFVFHHDHLCAVHCEQCTTNLKGHAALKEHEKTCGARLIPCKAADSKYLKGSEDNCNWKGQGKAYEEHKSKCRFLAREQARLQLERLQSELEQLKNKETTLQFEIKQLTYKEFFDEKEHQISEQEAMGIPSMYAVNQIAFDGSRACVIYNIGIDKDSYEHINYVEDHNPDPQLNVQYSKRLYQCKEDKSRYYIIYNSLYYESLRMFASSHETKIHNTKGIQLFPFFSVSEPLDSQSS